jgi:S-adenosylmethionine:tRNA ribosyltransferase-isomerase
VAGPSGVVHRRFRDLPELLAPGDLVVVNTSATVAAALAARDEAGAPAPLHVGGWLDDGRWLVEPRRADGGGPDRGKGAGTTLTLPGGRRLQFETAYPDATASSSRLWTARVLPPAEAPGVPSLITGLHPPEASHLLLLEAVAGAARVGAAYAAAVEEGCLSHEFGDSMLLLSEPAAP